MPRRHLIESFNNAIEGLAYVVKTQRNFRIHVGMAGGVVFLAVAFGVNRSEFLILLLAIAFVFAAEMVNTAVELVIDLTKDHFHPIARAAKDVAAGVVLVSAVNAVCVGCLIFADTLKRFLEGASRQVKLVPWHVSFLALAAVFTMVIAIKFLFHRGRPLLGGMPSGHAAFAFSLWTLVGLLQANLLVTLLVLILAFLVALHRVRAGFHTFWESMAGALLGMLTTLLVAKGLGI